MFKRQTLKNGIRLITAPLKETQTASLLVLVKVGSRQEAKPIEGISHFVEHLMFKGTKRRPTTLDLSKELDGIGAEYNAFTGKDVTGYYIKADAKHLSLAIDMLSDMLGESLFRAEEIEKEKGVIVEEINMYEDNPLMQVEGMLEEMIFDGGELSHQIAGSRETVKAASREKIVNYKKKYYAGANIVIGLAGKFNADQLKELKAKFKFNRGVKSKIKKSIVNQKSPRVSLKYKETEQVQMALGLPAFSYHDPRSYALQLLAVILGGNMSSRLFINVREKKGLAYFVRAWPNLYEDAGALVIQAGLDKIRIEEAIVTILGELNGLKAGVTTEELRRAKDFIAGKMALDLEDSMSIAEWYANLELSDRKLVTPQEKLKKIMAVKESDIKKVANDIFDLNRVNLAVIGPFKDDNKFKKLLK
ncbi:MAG: pitrilysin family protein [Patescibacteria group bacterium]